MSLWVYVNKIPIYPIFYLLEGDDYLRGGVIRIYRDYRGLYWGYIGIMGKKMETAI